MKRLSLALSFITCSMVFFIGCQSQGSGNSDGNQAMTTNPDSIQSNKDSVSYVLGKNMYQNFKRQGVDINEELVAKGLMDAVDGKDTIIAEERSRSLMREFQQRMMKKRREQMQQRQQQGNSPGGQQGGQGNRQEQMKKKLKKKLEEQRKNQSKDEGSGSESDQ